ncbi:hypothetical protein CSPAE12_00710 [Colletotrichum incanum]|nr:hypothetical protein CSPAE12_00710 [Colletotrichum incanum]
MGNHYSPHPIVLCKRRLASATCPCARGRNPTIIIPAFYIHIEVRVIRNFVPGVSRYDEVVTIDVSANGGLGIFRKWDVAILEEFTMYPPLVIQARFRRRTLKRKLFRGIEHIHCSLTQFDITPDPQQKFSPRL